MRLDGEELSSPPSRLLLTSAPSPFVDGRAREQASASDRTGQDIVAEAIDHVSDNTIAGDSIDVAAKGIDQCPGVVAGAVEHIADAAATGDGVNGLARGRHDRIDQVGSGIAEIRNDRSDSVGCTKDAIEPVSAEPIAAQAAPEDVIEIVDAKPIEQTAVWEADISFSEAAWGSPAAGPPLRVAGWVFVVAMSLSYSVGALIRVWFGCQPLWIADGSDQKRLISPTRSNLFQCIGPESYFFFGTFLDLKFRGRIASRIHPCHMRHTV
jgi:hypothetical protein